MKTPFTEKPKKHEGSIMKRDSSSEFRFDTETFPQELEKKLESKAINTYLINNSLLQTTTIQNTSVNHITEALKGNFMPSIIKLTKNEIEINAKINPITGDSLLHSAITFSFFNVTRTWIERFNADVNISNILGHSPLHICCFNQIQDLIILNYLLNIPDINIESEDLNGLTPICYAIINNFNIAFLYLVSKGADLSHIDKYGNGWIYFALVNNNTFVTKFWYSHCQDLGITVNTHFFSNTVTWSDILITNKNTKICKMIIKNYATDIDCDSLVHSCKFISDFPFYNKYNYELINTWLFYKAGDIRGFLNSIFPWLCCCLVRKKRRFRDYYNYYDTLSNCNSNWSNSNRSIVNPADISFRKRWDKNWDLKSKNKYSYIPTNDDMSYKYKKTNFLFFISNYRLFRENKGLLYWNLVYFIVSHIIYLSKYNFRTASKTTLLHVTIYINYILMIPVGLYSAVKILKENKISNNKIHMKYTINDKSKNIFHWFNSSSNTNTNAWDLPETSEICEICWTFKTKNTIHCMKCKSCVLNYYFHSSIFGTCIHNNNVRSYCWIWGSYTTSHFLFGMLIYKWNSLWWIFSFLYLLIVIRWSGHFVILLLCMGYNTTYYTLFKLTETDGKDKNDELSVRKEGLASIPKINNYYWMKFWKNIICCSGE